MDLENNIDDYEGSDNFSKEIVEESNRDAPIKVEHYGDPSIYHENLINTLNSQLSIVKNEWMFLYLSDSRWAFDVSRDGGLFDAIIHCLELSHSEIDSQIRGGKYKTKQK